MLSSFTYTFGLFCSDNTPYEKVGNNEPVSIADKVPFEIPESWEWARLLSVNNLYTGNSINETEKKLKYTEIPSGYCYIGTKDVAFNHRINYDNGVKIPYDNESFKIAPKDSILLCIEGGSAGRKIAFTDKDVCFGNKLCCFVSYGIDYLFLYYYLQSPMFLSSFNEKTTGIIGGVSVNTLKSMLFPIPPAHEQKRIVKEILRYEPLIDEYEKAYNKLSTLNKNFPAQLKQSILQLAVQGKLVPQDPNDEPASVLLERIRKEKEELIKEGKIKKDKNESIIFRRDNSHYEKLGSEERCIDDEAPFEIPDTWQWSRLKSVCTKLVDGDHNPPKGESIKTPYIMASSTNINNDSLVELEKIRYLAKDIFEKEDERTAATKGDIFFTSVGSLGRSCIYDGSLNICFQRSVSVISTLIFNKYLKTFFDCGYFQSKVQKEATGTAQKGFYLNQLANAIVPIPPLEEQRRIVEEVEALLRITSQLYYQQSHVAL